MKEEFLKKLTFANLKRNLKEQIRYGIGLQEKPSEILGHIMPIMCCKDCELADKCSFLETRYSLRKKNQEDVCEELILMLTDTLTGQLYGVGPEDVLTESQLEELQQELTEQVKIMTDRATTFMANLPFV